MTAGGGRSDKAKLARQFIEAIPHARALSMSLDAIGEGKAEISMPWDAHLVGDPATWVIAGGAVSALMDTCGGAAVMSHPEAPGGTATISLRIDYMRPAAPGQRIRARAEVYHITRSVAFVRASATDDDAGRPVAMATGTFTVERPGTGPAQQGGGPAPDAALPPVPTGPSGPPGPPVRGKPATGPVFRASRRRAPPTSPDTEEEAE